LVWLKEKQSLKIIPGLVWWCVPIIPTLGRLGQENQEFMTILGYKQDPAWKEGKKERRREGGREGRTEGGRTGGREKERGREGRKEGRKEERKEGRAKFLSQPWSAMAAH
jgi:hypothetical protein